MPTKVVDVDTHVVEPPDLWVSRVPRRFTDLVPRVQWDARRNEEAWYFGADRLGAVTAPAAAGWREFPPRHAARFDDLDPAVWEATARLRLMDDYGIHAQVLYPNVAGFGAGRFLGSGDPELSLACVRAYNDFLTDWCSAAPDRLVAVCALPFWDIELSVSEMRRCRDAGHRGIIFSNQPEYFGQPGLGDRQWDPLWAACQDLDLSVNFHIASGDMSAIGNVDPRNGAHANFASIAVPFFVGNARTLATLICAGICHRFPRLNFVSVESGVGWLPFALEALDWQWQNCGVPQEHPEYDLLPSEYFRRQIFGCFWFERGRGLEIALEILGPDNLMYETDFPHPTSMSPGPASIADRPADFIARELSSLPVDVLRKLLHDNAARVYHLD